MRDAIRARRAATRQRRVRTPEGVPLQFEIALAGDRIVAFCIDAAIMFLALLALGIAATAASLSALAPAIAVWFLIRSFYFAWFETRWQGATPGKRLVGLRVIDADGGPLRTDALIVRNFMREVEFWLPLALIAAPEQVWPDAPGWARLAALAWTLAFGMIPLFNRDRLRIGDFVGGTRVVSAPKATLLHDVGARAQERTAKAPEGAYEFTDAQLDIYGAYELQVLEDVLRRGDPHRGDAMRVVAGKIRQKIGWKGPVKAERFLHDFYAALRARLESRMLVGRHKKSKHDRTT